MLEIFPKFYHVINYNGFPKQGRPANNSHLSWNLDNAPNIFFENALFFTIFGPLTKSVQKKILIIDKEILLNSRNSDHSESDIEKKILIIFKERFHSSR